jgi:Ni,Fe-hydrogenase III large subunit
MNRVGGVNRDIEDPSAWLHMIGAIESSRQRPIIPTFAKNRTALERSVDVGVLSHEPAQYSA